MVFGVLINLSAITDFPLLCVVYRAHFNSIVMQPWLHWSIVKISTLIYPCLICSTARPIQKFLQSNWWLFYLFLSLSWTKHAYFLCISTMNSKNLTPILYLLSNCISARSAPQMVSLKKEYILHFLKFCWWACLFHRLIPDKCK